jgi:hypothetical protein
MADTGAMKTAPSVPPRPAAGEDTPNPTVTTPSVAPPRHSLPSLADMRHSLPSLADMRQSILSLPVFKPRWKPWSPGRVVATTMAFALVAGMLVVLTFRVTKRWAIATPVATASPEAPPAAAPPPPPSPRADASLSREHRSPLAGGLLTLPPSFASEDGAYDLVIHLHGNTDLVEESFAVAGVNAVVVILNLGNGSGPYEDRFANSLSLPEVVDRAQATMEKRGLAHATLRRLALSAWSAGYGGVLKVLEQPALAAKVDAVLLMDGIHVGYKPQSHDLLLDRLAPFSRFAEEAVAGRRLFSITHTHITPIGNYAGTRETTAALLLGVGVPREPLGESPAMPALKSIDGIIARKLLRPLEAETIAHRGGLTVREYAGDQPEHHMAHLIHMAVTVLPDLVAWWKR